MSEGKSVTAARLARAIAEGPESESALVLDFEEAVHEGVVEILSSRFERLRCPVCDTVWPLLRYDIERFTQQGWPKHCGQTMLAEHADV